MHHSGARPVILFLIAAFLGALGQYFYKTGAESGTGGFISWCTNFRFLIGIVCYITIMFLFIFSFKLGGELTVLYPVYATTFIWSLVIGAFLLGEAVTIYKVAGVILIIIGIALIAH